MKTETEILAMPLTQLQQLWVEFKQVPTSGRDFANARAVIELIQAHDEWEEPKQAEALATDNVIIDGKAVKKGESVKVYEWQFNALRRFLKDPKAKAPADGAAAKAALIAGLLLMLSLSAMAQVQTFVYGTFGQYNVQSIAGLNGGTNWFQGTNASFTTATITTNTSVVPNLQFINGFWTNTPTTNITAVITNVPGLVSMVNYDSFAIEQSYALAGAGTGTVSSYWDTSGDGQLWQSNALVVTTTSAGTAIVTTVTNYIQQQYGFIRLDSISIPATGTGGLVTNLTEEVIKKSNRQGP